MFGRLSRLATSAARLIDFTGIHAESNSTGVETCFRGLRQADESRITDAFAVQSSVEQFSGLPENRSQLC
eukprot:4954053-Alexandrium_andersonii.AAC.1